MTDKTKDTTLITLFDENKSIATQILERISLYRKCVG